MTSGWRRWICFAWLCLFPVCGNAATPAVSAGGSGYFSSSLFLNSDGSVWGAGNVFTYAPGATSPVRVFQLPNVIAVANSGGTQFALQGDGTLWGVGVSAYGDLADGTTENRNQPQRIAGLTGVRAFSASQSSHYLALLENGTVWAWGRNRDGQLGDGTQTDRHAPVQVIGLSGITRISAGFSASLALRSDGTVWVWGFTAAGAAGNGLDPNSASDPEWRRSIPTQVLHLDRVVAIAAGDNHNMALREDGTVWSWGKGDLGQNGTGAAGLTRRQTLPGQIFGLDHVIAIDTNGTSSAFALKSDGTVWAWGNNASGQLGVSGISYSAVPIQVPDLSDIVAISAGFDHVLAMRRDGTVLGWGSNRGGQLGDGTLQGRTETRTVQGPGGSGQLNLVQPAPSSFNQLPLVQINASVSSGRAPLTVNLSAGNASDADGSITAYYWQSGDGQRATGASARFVLRQAGTYQIDLLVEDNSGGRGHAAQQIIVTPSASAAVTVNPKLGLGGFSTVALANDGRILTWGVDYRVGRYNYLLPTGPRPGTYSIPGVNGITGAVDIAMTSSLQAHVLLADGTVLGWGGNDSGQVGTGSTVSMVSEPQLLSGLPPVQALAAGGAHALALTRDGRVFAWGRNTDGQLGLGDNQNRNAPIEIPGLSDVTAITAGSDFSMALRGDGTVWIWGHSCCSGPGNNTLASSSRPIQVPELASVQKIFAISWNGLAIKADGSVWVSGGSLPFPFAGYARLPSTFSHVPLLDGAVQLAGGGQNFILRKADGTVWVVGKRSSLALGIAGTGDIDVPQQVPGISDAIWVAAASDSRSMVLRSDGTVLAWGANTYGGIGDGTLAYQQMPVLVINETANGFLDLIPEVANTIPQDKIPPFLLTTYANGGLNSATLYADLRGISSNGSFALANDFGRFAAGYNVYVAANVPTIPASPYFQLNANNSWSTLNWPMAEFLRGVALDSQTNVVRTQILQNADLSSPQLAGASILVGYGTDADEMLRNTRYRTIFTVPQP